jgi:hypothetical protein
VAARGYFPVLARGLGASFHRDLVGPGQIEIVSHMRQQMRDVKADFRLALPAWRKLFALDGDDFMRLAMIEVSCGVYARGWHPFTGSVGSLV